MRKILHLLLVLIVAMSAASLYTSCSEEDNCSLIGRSMVYCNLYKINPENGITYLDTLPSLTVTALYTDSIIINDESNVRNMSLPLRYTDDNTILVFNYNDEENPELNDTVYITQNNTPFFESMKCGYTMTQIVTGVEYTKHLIDSIHIQNPNANTNGTENLKIFYRYNN